MNRGRRRKAPAISTEVEKMPPKRSCCESYHLSVHEADCRFKQFGPKSSGPTPIEAPQPHYIHTNSGRNFFFDDPSTISINDIAHALSNICRWTGHVKKFYSVAQHSAICAEKCPEFPLRALLHDAAEAYIGDINKPLKTMLGKIIVDIESRIERAVWTKFGLGEPSDLEEAAVKLVDQRVGATEAFHLMRVDNCRGFGAAQKYDEIVEIRCMEPGEAKALFLKKFTEIF